MSHLCEQPLELNKMSDWSNDALHNTSAAHLKLQEDDAFFTTRTPNLRDFLFVPTSPLSLLYLTVPAVLFCYRGCRRHVIIRTLQRL